MNPSNVLGNLNVKQPSLPINPQTIDRQISISAPDYLRISDTGDQAYTHLSYNAPSIFLRNCDQNHNLFVNESIPLIKPTENSKVIFVEDLFNPSFNPTIESEKVILQIRDLKDCKQLEQFLSTESKLICLHQIIGLDCISSPKFEPVIKLLQSIADNLEVFRNLTSLHIQFAHIQETMNDLQGYTPNESNECIISSWTQYPKISKLLNQIKNLTLDYAFDSNIFEISYPQNNHSFISSKLFSNLKTLSIYNFKENLVILSDLDNITTLLINKIEGSLKLPTSLDSLEVLSIKNVKNEFTLPNALNNLKELYIGDITSNFTFPKLLNKLKSLYLCNIRSNFTLPNTLDQLETFSIKNVKNEFTLPNALNNLKELYIGDITSNFIFPKLLNKLKSLYLCNIRSNFRLPNTLNQLETFSIKTLSRECTIKLPQELPNLKSINIEEMEYKATLQFPETLENLKELHLKKIYSESNLILPNSLPSLSYCTHYNIFEKTLCDQLHDLTTVKIDLEECLDPSSLFNSGLHNTVKGTLKIKNINELERLHQFLENQTDSNSILVINKIHGLSLKKITIDRNTVEPINKLLISILQSTNLFPNLKSLTIGDIWDNVTFNLPDILHNLTSLFIGNIYNRSTLTLPNSLEHLDSLSIIYVDNRSIIKLPNCLHKLSNFTLEYIDHSFNRITLPDSLSNLPKFIIGNIFNNFTFTLPNLFENLKELTIGSIEEGSTFNLTTTLNNLERLSIAYIDQSTVNLFGSMNNLQELTIEYINNASTCNITSPLSDLKNLIIGRIEEASTLILPNELNQLIKLSIDHIDDLSTLRLPVSSPNLKEVILKWGRVTIATSNTSNNGKSFTLNQSTYTNENKQLDLIIQNLIENHIIINNT